MNADILFECLSFEEQLSVSILKAFDRIILSEVFKGEEYNSVVFTVSLEYYLKHIEYKKTERTMNFVHDVQFNISFLFSI